MASDADMELHQAVQALARRTRILRLQERERAVQTFLQGTPPCAAYRRIWEIELANVQEMLKEMGDLS